MKTLSKFFRSIPQVYTFPLVLLGVILILFVVLQPTVISWWSSLYRKTILNTFITQLETSKQINPQTYWQFRERYSPGYMKMNGLVVGMRQTYQIIELPEAQAVQFMSYDSPYLESVDSILADQNILKSFAEGLPAESIRLQTDSILLTQKDPTHVQLSFVLPIEEMRKANGFFDYLPQEQQLLEDKLWLNTTTIRIQ
jgi:hypothetical protein